MRASDAPRKRLCECGCGTPVLNRFVRGHQSRGNKGAQGEKHHLWKGDEVGYKSLHGWLYRNKPRTGRCERCGTTRRPKTEFANISGEYKRDVNDYIELCTSCHVSWDNERRRQK